MLTKSGFKHYFILVLIVLSLSKTAYSKTRFDDWNFDDNYKKRMIFLHSFLNYELDINWQLDWHKNLFKSNGIKVSYGSVTVKDLNSSLEAFINQELGNGWYFRGKFDHIQQQMKYEPVHTNLMGFEKRIYKQLSIYSHCNPTYDKEDIDLLLGIALMNRSSDHYLRLALTYDDFLYDEKNPLGGEVTAEPLGVKWNIRYSRNGFLVTSSGKLMNTFEIEFPDSSLSPYRNFLKKKTDELEAGLYYLFSTGHIAGLEFSQYLFKLQENFYQETKDYGYQDRISDLAFKYNHHCHENLILKAVIHYVRQEAEAAGMRNYDFIRVEFLPMVILEFKRDNSSWEVGYLRTSYDLNLNDEIETLSFNRKNSIQKMLLRWTHYFTAKARLQFSVSHVPDIEGYGGGNLNFMLIY